MLRISRTSLRLFREPSKCLLVQTKVSKDLTLHGALYETGKKDLVIINIHGTGSNFYEEDFIGVEARAVGRLGVALLTTNNSGNAVMQSWGSDYQAHGCALEKFEDCLRDIDKWISFVLDRGYKAVILQGHSLGTEKVVYYMYRGKHRHKVAGVILLGFADSYGTQQQWLNSTKADARGSQQWRRGSKVDLLREAHKLVSEGKGYEFLRGEWYSHSGAMPMSAASYINFFSEGSNLSKSLPFRTGRLDRFKKISVPILGAIGDIKEYTFIPTVDAMKLMESENPNCETHQIKGADHDFEGKEDELVGLVVDWLTRRILHH